KKGEAEEKSGSITLSQGYHPIRLTFFEQWGPQVLEVRYEGPGVKLQLVPDDVLFLEAPEGESEPSNQPPTVYAGKDVEITLPQTEITLSANATDKDGKIVSYQWAKVSGPTAKFTAAKSAQTKVTNLVAGTYEFSVTVKDDQGAEATNKVKVVVNEAPVVDEGEPRLYYAYYQGDWSKLPDFEKLTAVKKGTLSNFNLNLRNRNEQFGFAFEGYIDIKTKGTYKFYTASDDGSALYINGQRIVNNDGLHGKKEQSGHITLTKGKHLIQVMYFEQSGDEILEVSYQGPGIAKTIIPEEILSLEGDPSSSPEEPEAPVAEGEPGLYYAYYVGEWDVLPDFSELQPESQGVVPNFTFA
ncbi:MAG: PA14 domain-containing protein, partial [Marinoscillum sp.]